MTTRLSTPPMPTARSADRARGSLLLFGALLLPLSLLGYWFLDATRGWLPLNLPSLPLMLTPAAASLATRLLRREGFADVSFRLGGRLDLRAMAVGLALPLVIGTTAYGFAYAAGLARLAPPELPLIPRAAGPLAHLAALLLLAGTLGTLALLPGAAGEEIGWRGYLLPRLIDAGVPQPLLVSGLLWGHWHLIPLFVSGYAAGPMPTLSAAGLLASAVSLGFVLAWLRLDTGSIWPPIVAHAAWNAVINGGFDLATEREAAWLWLGESGVLVALALAVVTLAVAWVRQRRAGASKP